MELIYSTGDLQHANQLSSLLSDAGVSNHVSGSHSAQLPGFSAGRTPSSIGVWLVHASDAARAHHVMLSHGFMSPPVDAPPAEIRSSFWLGVFAAILVLGLAALLASGA